MVRLIGLGMLLLGLGGQLFGGFPAGAPEIDPSAAVAALTLLSGGLVVLRARRRKN